MTKNRIPSLAPMKGDRLGVGGLSRRAFLGVLPALTSARSLLAAAGAGGSRLGLCTFSCHQHWRAAGAKQPGVKFNDAISFFRYARSLGAEGVQTSVRPHSEATARDMRVLVDETGAYYEGELRLPKTDAELAGFEADVRLTRAAGATVARAVFTGGRRYEIFQTMEDFRRFHAGAAASLTRAEPILRRHRLKVAIENHKDHTSEELAAMMRAFSSEWIGVLIDTGNNLALLEEPQATVEALAPFALSVHLKDMAVQPAANGFLLSEVPLGTGLLDLPRIVATLRRAKPALVFNLEMATRDPLVVPCRTSGYWTTFPGRQATHLEAALARVRANPPRQSPPTLTGKSTRQILAEEETNNRQGLAWMKQNLSA